MNTKILSFAIIALAANAQYSVAQDAADKRKCACCASMQTPVSEPDISAGCQCHSILAEECDEHQSEEPHMINAISESDIVLPMFPGGEYAMFEWLSENLQYPDELYRQKVEGRVVVMFVVAKDGSIRDAQVAQGVHADLDEEALRVVRSMPAWTPGSISGIPVDQFMTLPITFCSAD